jgi:hypothetical protein
MSTDVIHTYTVPGYLSKCPRCKAPMTHPFPSDGWLSVQVQGEQTWVIPHLPDCAAVKRDVAEHAA